MEPVKISRTDDGHLLTVVAEGPYSLREIEATLEAAMANSPVGRDCCLMMDIRRSEAEPSTSELRDFARFLGRLPEHLGRRAAWVVAADLRFGLARMLAAFAEPHGLTIGVFRDATEARTWLDEGHDLGHPEDRR